MLNGFKQYCEVAYGYYGIMTPFLGGGKWERLNYGGSNQFGLENPMLYVPVNIGSSSEGGNKSNVGKILSQLRRKVGKYRIHCYRDENVFTKYTCVPTSNTKDPQGRSIHISKFMPTGESHVTVAAYPQLVKEVFSKHFGRKTTRQEEIDFLKTVKIGMEPLFKTDIMGLKMPVSIPNPSEVIFGVSSFLDGNPLVALVAAECDRLKEVKEVLGLSIPNGYKIHLTIGYANAIWDLPNPDKRFNDPSNVGGSARSGPIHNLRKLHNKSYLNQNPDENLPEGLIEVGRMKLWD